MALIDDIKTVMRISSTAFDVELTDLIAAAKQDLKLSGVTDEHINNDTDPLIKRAVSVYVKTNFGWDNPDADRLQKSYDMLKMHLTLSQEYSMFTITFTVTSGIPLENAVITFNNEEKITNTLGVAVFPGVKSEQNMSYTVKLDGYVDFSGIVDIVDSASVAVSMVVI